MQSPSYIGKVEKYSSEAAQSSSKVIEASANGSIKPCSSSLGKMEGQFQCRTREYMYISLICKAPLVPVHSHIVSLANEELFCHQHYPRFGGKPPSPMGLAVFFLNLCGIFVSDGPRLLTVKAVDRICPSFFF